jgi:hypothetical protein
MSFAQALTAPLEQTGQMGEIFYRYKEAQIIVEEWVKITTMSSFIVIGLQTTSTTTHTKSTNDAAAITCYGKISFFVDLN